MTQSNHLFGIDAEDEWGHIYALAIGSLVVTTRVTLIQDTGDQLQRVYTGRELGRIDEGIVCTYLGIDGEFIEVLPVSGPRGWAHITSFKPVTL